MKIKKIGHCCLLVEIASKRILTDPGAYSQAQDSLAGIDAVFITHEHPDHLHLESLKAVLRNSPKALVFTNRAVGKILRENNISFQQLEHGQEDSVLGFSVKGLGEKHAPIYPSVPEVLNTGYFFDNRFFYPGDAFYVPVEPVEILALPVAGPWMRLAEAIDYAKRVRPKTAFPVHDGMLKIYGPAHALPQRELSAAGIDFVPMDAGGELER